MALEVKVGSIYISGTSKAADANAYPGSGTPWTSQATTPIKIAIDSWFPKVAEPSWVFGGGPPFRNGQTPVTKTYPNVTEEIPVILKATTPQNAITLYQTLDREISTAQYSNPTPMQVRPVSASGTIVYFDVYSAHIQPDPKFLGSEAPVGSAHATMRCTMTLVRSPHGTSVLGTSSISALAGASFGNVGTGSPDDNAALSFAPTGDMLYEGTPMKILVTPVGVMTTLLVASVKSVTYGTSGSGAKTTSSTTGTSASTIGAAANLLGTKQGISGRVFFRLSNCTSNAQIRVEMTNGGSVRLFTGKWITPPSGVASLNDMGDIPLDYLRRAGDDGDNLNIYIGYKSTDGSSATATLDYTEYLEYYDYARVDGFTTSVNNPTIAVHSFRETTGLSCLPLASPVAYTRSSGGGLVYDPANLAGTAPRLFSGALLWVNWLKTGNVHDKTDTATVTATYAPLFRSVS